MFSSPAHLQLPENLQHYRIDACLLDVGLLSVYQIWDSKLHRAVQMHVIRQFEVGPASLPLAESDHLNSIYLQQARKAASLQHPAFIRIHALEEFNQQLILITEAVSGIDLMSWIQQHGGQKEFALRHLAQLAAALQEAHAVGLAHGDLRSANLLVDNVGAVRVPIVGLVLHQSITTPDHDLSHDVFSLGLLLYEMMAARRPDLSSIPLQDTHFPWPESISPDLRELILSMTAPVLGQRISCQQVVEQCRVLLATEFSSASTILLNAGNLKLNLPPERQPTQPRRARHILLTGLLVLLVVGGVTWQLNSYWPKAIRYLTPYSESKEMTQAAGNLVEYTYRTDAKRLDSAQAHLTKVLERTPDHAGAAAYMSILYLSKYSAEKRDEIWFQKAKASAQQAMMLDGELAISLLANARILQWHHRLEDALAMTARARDLDPDNLLVWHTQVSVLLEMRRFSEAIPLAEKGANKFPQDRYLLDLQAGMYLSQKKFVEAESVLRNSLQRQPDSPLAYSLLAECLTSQQRDADALQVIQQGLQVRPNANLYGALANAKFRTGDYAAAADAFAQAVSPDKGIAGSYLRWFEYAESLMWVPGRESAAIQAYQRALELLDIRLSRSPDDETLLSTKSVIMVRLADIEQAKLLARRAIARHSEDPYVHFWLAFTFELLQDREQSLNEIRLAKQFGLPLIMIETHPGLKALRSDHRYAGL
ncbi:tetratricopeptide repeat protein [Undibacterium sp. Ji22W]|uniref:tetratricopeptide repeat protein n=1 Tax=Undibacterium sp. Ji22W TaxID=3413038 RepID=UPI003BF3951B